MSDATFRNRREVLDFLRAEGWVVGQSTLYRHADEGKLKCGEGGEYAEAAVRRYAKAWLKQAATGKTEAKGSEDLQREKLQADIEAKREAALSMREKRERESGRWVLRSEAALDLAARAGALQARLKHAVHSKVLDWVALVEGRPTKAQALRQEVEAALDDALADYARQGAFEVVFEKDEQAKEDSHE